MCTLSPHRHTAAWFLWEATIDAIRGGHYWLLKLPLIEVPYLNTSLHLEADPRWLIFN